ncbi:ABC transporter substrate-binding protein [Actinoplanes sp. KI2]|uniref:ABC transporter substrate-binding protein n=1 Tax=Actinoplanes sp. KI2 TaxID=2983315 RepID=UPI0021D5D361|nr:ABC transporter substrate-binding protein [Actinoplanes sp. KI2]MCU7723088.1 ABC transporter substrate-binding protein [Actinoplanes sp. KI2]
MKKIVATAGAVLLLALSAGCGSSGSASGGDAMDTTIRFDQALHDKLPQPVRNTKSIRFITDASYAPMEMFAPDGRTIVGFEADLADALGRVLGVRVEMVNGTFQTALAQVADGTFDGMLSAATDTPAREKKVDFVDYFSAGTSIVVQRGNPAGVTGLDTLCGQIVAVEQGTTQAEMVDRLQQKCGARPIRISRSKTHADALLQLRTGRAAAVLDDYPAAMYRAADSRTGSYFELASHAQYEPGLFGIAVAKENTALRDTLQAALNQLIASGAYGDLLARWNLSGGAVTSAVVNRGH